MTTFHAAAQSSDEMMREPHTLFYEDGKTVKERFTNVKTDSLRTRQTDKFWPNGDIKDRYITENYDEISYKQHYQSWQQEGILTNDIYTERINPEGFDQVGKSWYNNGTLAREWQRANNGDDFTCKVWYQNGTLGRVFTTVRGSLNGTYQKYDSLGTLRYSGNYANGVRHGKCTEFAEEGQMVFENMYSYGKPTIVTSRSKAALATDCKPVHYNDTACDSVVQLINKVAANELRGVGGTDTFTVAQLDSMKLALTRIWNFLSIERPNSYALYLNSYGDFHDFPVTNLRVTPLQGGAKAFVFEHQDVTGWRVFPHFAVMYYTDGSIEFPVPMGRIDLYDTNELDY